MLKHASFTPPVVLAGSILLPLVLAGACSSSKTSSGFSTQSGGVGGASNGSGAGNGSGVGGSLFNTGGSTFAGGVSDAAPCGLSCSPGEPLGRRLQGQRHADLPGRHGCDLDDAPCSDACTAAADNKQSVGCDYYATHMEMDYPTQCFAAFVANTWNTPAHLTVDLYPGTLLTPELFAYIPSGTGSNITYTAYTQATGIPPGQVAILFLSGSASSPEVPCPAGVLTASPQGSSVAGTGRSRRSTSRRTCRWSAYQINPYGGGSAAITGASLLLPTSVWDTNYIAVTAAKYSSVTMDNPSINIVSATDGNMVTLLPNVAIVGSGGTPLPAGPANVPYTFKLDQGQQAQFSQQGDLTGTIILRPRPSA